MGNDISGILSSGANASTLDSVKIATNLILNEIDQYRSDFQIAVFDDALKPTNLAPIKESFCHAFFRLLGLPIISADQSSFYNPGFSGNIETYNDDSKKTIDSNQDKNLLTLESKREAVCYQNNLAFNNNTTRTEYMISVITNPAQICIMNPPPQDSFTFDEQTYNHPNRKNKFNKVTKILRPFKCVPSLTNNINPVTKSVCVPFLNEDNCNCYRDKLPRPYIEMVARIRLSQDIKYNSSTNIISKNLYDAINSNSYLSFFSDNIKNLSVIEGYIFEQMFSSMIAICNKIKIDINENIKVGQNLTTILNTTEGQIDQEAIKFTSLEQKIAKADADIAYKELILAHIPTYKFTGANLSAVSRNPQFFSLNGTFIDMVQPEIDNLKKTKDQLNSTKQKYIKKFDSINKSIFLLLGEVNGFGLVDALAMMVAFWLLPIDHLISMFDIPSFQRMLSDPELNNVAFENRKNNNNIPLVPISVVINAYDKIVYNLLKLADDIIQTNKYSSSS